MCYYSLPATDTFVKSDMRSIAIPFISSVLEDHSPIASLFWWDFPSSCVPFDKSSTDMARREFSAIAELLY